MEYAISFAETGHLCVSTMHASNAEQALDRIVHFFPDQMRQQIFLDLSLNLEAIVAQRLIPAVDGSRVPAIEVMRATPLIKDLIYKGQLTEIREIIKKSGNLGMKTFDDALYELFKTFKITEQEALLNADSKNNLRLRINLEHGNIGSDSDLSLKDEN